MSPLPKSLQNRPFTYSEASSRGVTQYVIRQLLASGELERIEHGLYQVIGGDISEIESYRRALKKVGEPSAICLLSALSHYGLTDIIPKQVWVMVPPEKRVRSRNLKLYRAREPHWKIGIITEDGCSITSLERTLVDALTHIKLLAPRIGLDALKHAITDKRTTTSKILEMSRSLGVKHRVLPYMEVLS